MKTRLLSALIVILVLVHVWLAIPAIQNPLNFQLPDSYEYLDLARAVLSTGKYQGIEYPGVDLLRPPGYPMFLVVSLWLGQGWPGLISTLQVLILLLTAWILYRICSNLGHPHTGLFAMLIYLLNPNAAFWSMVVLSETLASFWLTSGIWCILQYWRKAKIRWLLLAGLALGAGALTRPIFLPLGIDMGIVLFLLEWRRTRKSIPSLKFSVLFFIGLLVLVIPWQLRNLQAHGRFTLSEVGGSTFQNWYVAKALATAEGISRDEAAAIIASSPDPMKYSLGVIRQYPGIFIKEQVRGILRTLLGAEYGTWAKVWGGREVSTTGVLSAFIDTGSPSEIIRSLASQAKNPWLWAGIYAAIYDIALYISVLIGVWRGLGNNCKELVYNLAVILVLSLIYLLIIPGPAGESRFRVPADPLLALAASLAFLKPGIPRRQTG